VVWMKAPMHKSTQSQLKAIATKLFKNVVNKPFYKMEIFSSVKDLKL